MKSLSVEIHGEFSKLSFDFKHEFDNGITTLLGHIGSGKSTIVNSISGFNKELKSLVNINGSFFNSLISAKTNARPISVMFQDTRLLPHLTVKENILFALKKSKVKKTISKGLNIENVIEALNINHLLNKFPDQLSGGQQQLVNLCRTLAIKSDFIILDEPMSSLDIKNKSVVLSLLKQINQHYKIPILIISHSVEEIAQISDKVIIIEKGKKIYYGNLSQIFLKKEFTNIFGKFESSSILEGVICDKNLFLNITKIMINDFEVILPGDFKKIGEKVRVRIRARDVLVSKKLNSNNIIENQLMGTVTEITDEEGTAFSELIVRIGENRNTQLLLARITKYQSKKLKIDKNDKIYVSVKSTSFDRQAII
ncbi:MAG: hypothetical protein CMN44_08190 [SAR116 cluster bacterium]|nr:hypothetical protein [SAR116 cluster bacterium]RPH08867.1 MAG: ATP-binding cassette domain-containing protein [Alphaproteobacteria bacterium TMED54]|tara:strand:- start:2639 stop:3742 length:1104 start_codon:yes stop_codon:yes gene_type:complete